MQTMQARKLSLLLQDSGSICALCEKHQSNIPKCAFNYNKL